MHNLTEPQSRALVLIHEALHNKALTKKELGKAIGWSWPTLTKYVNRFEFLRCLEWEDGCLVLGDKAILYYRRAQAMIERLDMERQRPKPEKEGRWGNWGRHGYLPKRPK